MADILLLLEIFHKWQVQETLGESTFFFLWHTVPEEIPGNIKEVRLEQSIASVPWSLYMSPTFQGRLRCVSIPGGMQTHWLGTKPGLKTGKSSIWAGFAHTTNSKQTNPSLGTQGRSLASPFWDFRGCKQPFPNNQQQGAQHSFIFFHFLLLFARQMIPITTLSNKAGFSTATVITTFLRDSLGRGTSLPNCKTNLLWGATGGDSRGELMFQRAPELVPGLVFHCSRGKH